MVQCSVAKPLIFENQIVFKSSRNVYNITRSKLSSILRDYNHIVSMNPNTGIERVGESHVTSGIVAILYENWFTLPLAEVKEETY